MQRHDTCSCSVPFFYSRRSVMAEVNRRLYLLYLLYLRRKKRYYKQRQLWVHPVIKVRYLEGTYYTLFEKLANDPDKFFNYFRMRKNTFDYILDNIINRIKKQDTPFRMCIPPEEMLVVTIRYLATGCTLTELHYNYRIGISTLSKNINFVCGEIWNSFRSMYLRDLTQADWREVANEFQHKANFPMCLGAIDGKHIRIENFPHAGSMNFNYKKYYSIVLLAIADADYSFLFVDIGAYGKDCDSSILQNTEFWRRLVNDELYIPEARPLTPEMGLKVPYVFVADNAFPMNEHILKDFSNHNMSIKQRVFNYRLHRARRYVECAFGILSNKWRIFHRAINVSKSFSMNIVKACIVLHNIVRKKDGYRTEDLIVSSGSNLQNLPPVTTQSTNKTGQGVRTCFANYFVSKEGQLPWQLSKI